MGYDEKKVPIAPIHELYGPTWNSIIPTGIWELWHLFSQILITMTKFISWEQI